jgi:hypothetical protein
MRRTLLLLTTIFAFQFCGSNDTVKLTEEDMLLFEKAEKSGQLANTGFVKCNNYLNAWMSHRDPATRPDPKKHPGKQRFLECQRCSGR